MIDHFGPPPIISELIRHRKPGFGLERSFYVSPDVFAWDIERVYSRNWIYAGHASKIPATGDYFTYSIGSDSLLVIRDQSGQIHVLFNVCRHRGSRICIEPTGNSRKLVCPYHAWTYDIDGRLLGAGRMPRDFNRAVFGLRRCNVLVIEGLIFFCIAEDPPDFDAVRSDLESFLGPHGLREAKACHRETLYVCANWKILAENFWECYHCPPVHPEFCAIMTYPVAWQTQRGREQQDRFVREWEAIAAKLGHKVGRVKPTDGRIYRCERTPIRPGYVTQSRDGQPVAPLMGTLRDYDGGVTGFQIYPVLWFSAASDHAVLTRFTPLATTLTEIELTWLVHPKAAEGVDYDVERVKWVWSTTVAQDVTICENVQLGVQSSHYVSGPYSEAEVDVERFHNWYLAQIT